MRWAVSSLSARRRIALGRRIGSDLFEAIRALGSCRLRCDMGNTMRLGMPRSKSTRKKRIVEWVPGEWAWCLTLLFMFIRLLHSNIDCISLCDLHGAYGHAGSIALKWI